MEHLTDLSKWEFHYYLVAAGIVVVLLALIIYFIPGFRIKMPAIIVSSLGFLAAGVGLGMLTMTVIGWRYPNEPSDFRPGGLGKSGGAMPNMMKGGGMSKGGGKGKGGGGRGGAPSSKAELATLVGKLDLLTSKPLAVQLSDEKKAKVAQVLQDLDKKDDLSEEEAKKKLDVLEDQLKDDKDVFVAVGFRWPGDSGGSARPPAAAPNPFKEPANNQHLKALQERLSKGKAH